MSLAITKRISSISNFCKNCFSPIQFSASKKRFVWLSIINILAIAGIIELLAIVPIFWEVFLAQLIVLFALSELCVICQRFHDVGYPWYYGLLAPLFFVASIILTIVVGLYPYTGWLNLNFVQYSLAATEPIAFFFWCVLLIVSATALIVAIVKFFIIMFRQSNFYVEIAPFKKSKIKFNSRNWLYLLASSALITGISLGSCLYMNLQIPENSPVLGAYFETQANTIKDTDTVIDLSGYTDTSSDNQSQLQYIAQMLSTDDTSIVNIQSFDNGDSQIIIAEMLNTLSDNDKSSLQESIKEFQVADNVYVDPSTGRIIIITNDLIYYVFMQNADYNTILQLGAQSN